MIRFQVWGCAIFERVEQTFDLLNLRISKLDFERLDVVMQVLDLATSDEREDIRILAKNP